VIAYVGRTYLPSVRTSLHQNRWINVPIRVVRARGAAQQLLLPRLICQMPPHQVPVLLRCQEGDEMDPRPHLLARQLAITRPLAHAQRTRRLGASHVLLFPDALADLPEPVGHDAGHAQEQKGGAEPSRGQVSLDTHTRQRSSCSARSPRLGEVKLGQAGCSSGDAGHGAPYIGRARSRPRGGDLAASCVRVCWAQLRGLHQTGSFNSFHGQTFKGGVRIGANRFRETRRQNRQEHLCLNSAA
jgi:hypothetical protein